MNWRSLFLLLFTVFSSFSLPAFAEESPTSENYTNWEKENATREVAEEEKFSALWTKTLALLAIAIALLFISTWATKHFSRYKAAAGAKDTYIQIIEKKAISPKSAIYLLEIDGQKVAISESANGVLLLLQTPDSKKLTPHV